MTAHHVLLIVATFMGVLPLLSIVVDSNAPLALLVIKWFVFWSVGWRLLLAGIRQIAQPAYTARVILGLKRDESLLLVRELGFANVAFGTIGIVSMVMPASRLAAALAGGIFYALAGTNHLFQPHRNRLENVAMVSDLGITAVLPVASGFVFATL